MIEDTLREGLSSRILSQGSSESKGLIDRQVCFDNEHWSSHDLTFFNDMSSSLIQYSIDSSDNSLRALNFNQINWLQESGFSSQDSCIETSSSCRNNLTSSSMDGISMKSNIMDVESNCSKILVTENRL